MTQGPAVIPTWSTMRRRCATAISARKSTATRAAGFMSSSGSGDQPTRHEDVMAITLGMAKMTVRSTFALDPGTVESLDRLARRWRVSKSDALRRIVNAASAVESVDATADAL
ncbi:MAG: ribbon-helix-helix protein, CopG family, partial [Gemmatimonadetes bacterium]|nr:ribbon-helix-helix protein, CopG family [Gemmatimonadota bacterium]